MKTKLIFLIVISFFSCKEVRENKIKDTNKVKNTNKAKINEEQVVTISQITTNYDTLIKKVLNKGDVDSYSELFYGFMDANEVERTDSIMKYSRVMAEHFNNGIAYLDYFQAFCRKYDVHVDYKDYSSININKMDKTSKKQALDWLNKMLKNNIITQKEFDAIKK